MLQVSATGRHATVRSTEPITTGSVGLPVELELSDDFAALAVTVCFEAGDERADVAYLGDPVAVPSQCLTTEGATLRIGVYGALPNGTIVIPTVWATVGLVRKGAAPSGVDPSQPEPDWTAQVLAAARDAKETAERIAGEVDEWAEAEAERVRAEDARDSAEAARRSAEQARAGAETIRADAETQRVNAEGIRITNESARTSNELARATAEQGRATAETGRALAETSRAEAEQARATAETARNGAEAARAQAESQRADAERQRAASETARATAEQARATAEQGRAAAETARAEAETLRATAEQGRADAEASRAQAWAELEADVTAATDAATEAAAALRPEVDWLRNNQLTKELSGEFMQASDAYGAPVLSLGVDGKSTQVQTTGKNLFDKNGDNYGYWSTDGVFHETTANRYWRIPVSEGDVIQAVASQSSYVGTSLVGFLNGEPTGGVSYTTITNGKKVVVPSGIDELSGNFGSGGWNSGIVTKNNTDMTYEPYTGEKPSPSPAYPQAILSVDVLSLYMTGRNICGGGALVQNAPVSALGEDDTGKYVICGYGISAFEMSTGCHFKENQRYSFIIRARRNATAHLWTQMHFDYTDGTSQNISFPSGTSVGTTATFVATSSAGKTVRSISASPGFSNNTYVYYEHCGIFDGVVTADQFEPYAGHTVPLYDGTLRSLPDGTKDTLALSYLRPSTREGWAWYSRELVQRVGAQTYDGTENWKPNGAWYGFNVDVPYNCASTVSATKILNTRGVGTAYSKAGMQSALGATGIGEKLSYNWENAVGTGRTPDFKAWLAENNMTVLYPLATSVTTQLDPIELPFLPAPNCTVWADPTTGLTMEYVRDTNIVIASLEAAYADLATS